jgi:hypothetical protein
MVGAMHLAVTICAIHSDDESIAPRIYIFVIKKQADMSLTATATTAATTATATRKHRRVALLA